MRKHAVEFFLVRKLRAVRFALVALTSFSMALAAASLEAQQNPKLTIHWDKVTVVSKSTPTLQVVVNPPLRSGEQLGEAGRTHLPSSLARRISRASRWICFSDSSRSERRSSVTSA